MLKSLNYSVTFASTGRTLSNEIEFATGLTAISGPNESGKSTILEMIRFALFGTPALRGPIKSLRDYDVELVFELRGKEWTVRRTPCKAALIAGDEVLVSGVSPVDARIVQLFGYGLNVFDIANNCNQGDVEALTRLKPAERKRLVDKTIGFDVIDKLSEWVGEKASESRGEVKAINPAEPVRPEVPVDYVASSLQQEVIRGLNPTVRELNEIRGWLSVKRVAPVEPKEVAECKKEEVDAYDAARAEQAKLAGLPEPRFSEFDLDVMDEAWTHYVEYHEFKQKHGERPVLSVAEIEQLSDDMSRRQLWENKDELQHQIAKHKSSTIKCPQCEAHFPLQHDHVKAMENELRAYDHVLYVPPVEGDYDQDDLERMLKCARAWAGRPETIPVKPFLTPRDIELHRTSLKLAHLRKPLPPDPTPRYRAYLRYLDARRQYDEDEAAYKDYAAERYSKFDRMAEIEHVEATLENVNRQLKSSLEYEAKLAAYDSGMIHFNEEKERKEQAQGRLTEFDNAGKGLKALRSMIKQHLVPSLNAAASELISRMTGGQRTSVVVDENFETIEVDGQDIATLSGSGKVVANLAIRIGLGQVLTNKVFSVFMGDEIDASMDADRAGYTAECLQGLTGSIKQILLVSHKEISTAERHITLTPTTPSGAYDVRTGRRLERVHLLHQDPQAA